MRKTKQKESSQSDPSTRVMVLFFRPHIPEYPHKTIPFLLISFQDHILFWAEADFSREIACISQFSLSSIA